MKITNVNTQIASLVLGLFLSTTVGASTTSNDVVETLKPNATEKVNENVLQTINKRIEQTSLSILTRVEAQVQPKQ